MKGILVPVDAANPARMAAALAETTRIYAQEAVDVHLLSVQPEINGHVAMHLRSHEMQALQQAAGAEDLAPAQAVLEHSHVPCTTSVRVGRSADTIARTARELGCDRIVLGPEGPDSPVDSMLGSLAQQLRELVSAGTHCRVIGT